MCAINGVTTNDEVRVRLMNEKTKHRGPDGTGVWSETGITLGHNRLAIIDLDPRSLQPMHEAHGRYHIVFNGEIYNYRELRRELEHTYTFKTESDTEVLLVAYREWGEGMLTRLRGIFAFGIWDSEEKTLLLARDHMGVKPLYYRTEGGVLAFSSELQGLLGEQETFDHEAVALFLELQYVPSGRTFVRGIEKLKPGHLLRARGEKIEVREYYSHYESDSGEPRVSLYETIDTAVKRQLVSDRPVGVFLSGGFDSSIVLHHVHAHAPQVETFSIGFDGAEIEEKEVKKYNADATLAEITARHYGTKHHAFTLEHEAIAKDLISIYESIDEPVSTSTSVSQYFLNKYVREQGVVVALGGDGGDELFGGYTRHRAIMAAYYFQKLPRFVQSLVGKMHPRGKKLQTPFGSALHLELMATDPDKVASILSAPLDTLETTRAFLEEKYREVPNAFSHPLDTYMRIDRQTWLADHSLTRSDRTSMIHGIEFRVPLLDLDVVSYADTLSPFRKTTPLQGKTIIRDTYRGKLPEHLYREPKRGWLSPGAKWLRNSKISPVVRAILSPEYYNGLSNIFDWKSVEAMFDAHVDGSRYAFHPLWSVLILQIWARKHNIHW